MSVFPWDWAAVGAAVLGLLESDAGKALREGMTAQAIDRTKKAWQKVEWEKEEERYRSKLLPFVRTTRLLGNPKAIDIDALFSEVFVFDTISALRRSSELRDPSLDRSTGSLESRERRSARDLVEKGEHVYLLGHPGAGKTTFLRYIAVLCCKGIIGRVPVYVELNDAITATLSLYGDDEKLRKSRFEEGHMVRDAVDRAFRMCKVPDPHVFAEGLMATGQTVLLLDGLDEVPVQDGLRDAVISEIRRMQLAYPNTQICLTCRLAASEYTFEHFRYAEVAPFTIDQQRTFIAKWFLEQPVKRQTILATWGDARMAQLRDLGRTPLLLALVCLSFDELGEIPERHVDLFREALDALFKRWDSSRSIKRDLFYGGLAPYRREQLVQELAAELFVAGKFTFTLIDVQELLLRWYQCVPELRGVDQRDFQTAEILQNIEAQHGIVIQRSKDEYSFAHLSIQEFLCARSVREGHPERTLAQIATQRVFDPRWREVIIFTAGLLQEGTEFLRMMVESLRLLTSDANLVLHLQRAERGADCRVDLENFRGSKEKFVGLTIDLVDRIDSLPWLGVSHPLRGRACAFLESCSCGHAGDKSNEYVRIVRLIVDCAAVSNCSSLEDLLAPVFTSSASLVRWNIERVGGSER